MSSVMPIVSPVFNAELIRVIDGDTLVVMLHKHHGDRSDKKIRLLGVDTPELTGTDKEAGIAARTFVLEWLGAESLVVQTVKIDSFGRWLSYVWRTTDGASLADALRDSGHARAVSVLAQLAEARGDE